MAKSNNPQVEAAYLKNSALPPEETIKNELPADTYFAQRMEHYKF